MSNKKIEDSSQKFKEISLFRNPIQTTITLSGILKDQFFLLLKFLISHKFLIILGTLYCCLNLIEGYHKNVKKFLIIVLGKNKQDNLFLCLLGNSRNCIKYRPWYRTSYFCFVFRSTYSQGYSSCQ